MRVGRRYPLGNHKGTLWPPIQPSSRDHTPAQKKVTEPLKLLRVEPLVPDERRSGSPQWLLPTLLPARPLPCASCLTSASVLPSLGLFPELEPGVAVVLPSRRGLRHGDYSDPPSIPRCGVHMPRSPAAPPPGQVTLCSTARSFRLPSSSPESWAPTRARAPAPRSVLGGEKVISIPNAAFPVPAAAASQRGEGSDGHRRRWQGSARTSPWRSLSPELPTGKDAGP